MKGISVYYNRHVKAWMRSGSSQKYSSKKKAELGAKISLGMRLSKFRFSYENTKGYITQEDRPTGTPENGEWQGGTSEGHGFFDLFFDDWFSEYSISELKSLIKNNDDIKNMIRRIYIQTDDDFTRLALARVLDE